MKTVEVTRLYTDEVHHVSSVFCEVDRGEDIFGDIVFRFFVYGSENLGPLGVENILIAAFLDPDRAMDLVEYFRAQLQEEE